jgi:hypothetical protein
MKLFIRLTFLTLLTNILFLFNPIFSHEYKLKDDLKKIFSKNQKDLFKIGKEKFLFANEIITSFLNSSKDSKKKFSDISFEKIIMETIKFIKNYKMIESMQGEINQGSSEDTILCKSCIFSFNTLNFIVKEYYKSTKVLILFEKICSEILEYSKETCALYVNEYTPIIVDSLIDSHLTGEYLCSNKYFCKNLHKEYFNPDDYARKLLADKPKNLPWKKNPNGKTLKILHLTDMHTDLGYTEGSNANCQNPVCCQKTDEVEKLKFLEHDNEIIEK